MTVQLLIQATMMRDKQATMTEEQLRLESRDGERREEENARERTNMANLCPTSWKLFWLQILNNNNELNVTPGSTKL
jgi:hypothetical protein